MDLAEIRYYEKVISTRFETPNTRQKRAWSAILERASVAAETEPENCWQCGVMTKFMVERSWCPCCASLLARKNLAIIASEEAE